jgi:subtilisin family serine protease
MVKSVLIAFVMVFLLVGSLFGLVGVVGAARGGSGSNDVDYSSKISDGLIERFDSGEREVKVVINVREEDGSVPLGIGPINEVISVVGVGKIYDGVGFDLLGAELTKKEVLRLVKNRYVHSVGEVRFFEIALQDVVNITDAEDVWPIQVVGGVSFDGTGQTIAIVDTGINFTNEHLYGKNYLENNLNLDCESPTGGNTCVEDNLTVTDLNGHGTHVAGIAGNIGSTPGVSKGADLIALKVFSGNSGVDADIFDITRALDWILNNFEEHKISVVSMSLSANGETYPVDVDCDTVIDFIGLDNLIDNLVMNGVAVVSATGNGGSDSEIAAPACLPNVIPVAATNKNDTLKASSNYNGLVSLFAPGDNVSSTCIGGVGNDEDGDGYCVKSGTSMSTPVVSGSIAIIQQLLALGGEPRSMHPKQVIENLLFDTADPIDNLDFGQWRRININEAIKTFESDFNRGDVNDDGVIDISDPVRILGTLFPAPPGGAGEPPIDDSFLCQDAGDVNDDGIFDIADAIYMLTYIFQQGPEPLQPFEFDSSNNLIPGPDPTTIDDNLRCYVI